MKVYTLTNPTTGFVFYVGLTKLPLNVRLLGHISSSKNLKSEKDKIIFDIISINKNPQIEVLEEFKDNIDKKTCLLYERYWIEQMRVWGFCLLNLSGTPENKLQRFGKKYKKKPKINKNAIYYRVMYNLHNGTPIKY